ncbi:hypothetical protein H4S03_002340, partial [Coemansia sp. S3946]
MCSEVEMTQGTGRLVGKIAYLEQQPRIMNDTLQANVLFGRDYDEDYYWKVLGACALIDDLEVWPNSDLTVIGKDGINISGGQRARLALARTVYSRADIYFLDDPLSAVDAIVKRHILDNIILSTGLLGDKLRFVISNADSISTLCNQVVMVDNGSVSVKVQTPQVHTVPKCNTLTICKPKMGGSPSNELQTVSALKKEQTAQWPLNGKIELRDFGMKYGVHHGYALKNVNLTINPGEKIGIVGRTGAGKSSLAKVLFRFIHDNTSGSISIDGQDISEFGVGDYRPRLGMIPQESSMFNGSIRNNLDPLNQFDVEEMWAALIKCGLAKHIITSGQQQLFGLCRVIMRNQKIVVLDEATANVDLETDKSIQELISKEFRDCTVLTIAHRLETIMNSDRIIVMDKGTIAEIGTPQELLAKDGMFALLVKTSDFGHSVLTDEHYGAVVEIPEGRAVVFQGIVNVCILSGTVSVCKYSIMPESQWKRVYASSAADLNHQVIPLIVNMQGWLKGLGLDLHYSLCDSVKPTNYVQLYDSGSMPERSDEAWEWLAGNGLVPIINFSGIKACDLCL